MSQEKKTVLSDYSPIIVFIFIFFVFKAFSLADATTFLIASIAGVLTFSYEVYLFKKEHRFSKTAVRRIGFYMGLLTIALILVVIVASLHWMRSVDITTRTILLFAMLIFYFVLLFRAINGFQQLKPFAEKIRERNRKK